VPLFNGKVVIDHIVRSAAPTFPTEEWVKVEVHGNDEVIHRINGVEVLRFPRPAGGRAAGLVPEYQAEITRETRITNPVLDAGRNSGLTPVRNPMSLLFFKRVLANPIRVGYLVPSSGFLTRQTAKRIDFSKPRVVIELGPGEGCHTRQIVRRMNADSRLILIELDEHFARHLTRQFAADPRVTVVQADALDLVETLEGLGVANPDYIYSGIPFTIMDRTLRERLLANIAMAMGPGTTLITYQVSLMISEHELFTLSRSEQCLFNVPPIKVLELTKALVAVPA
jgi:phospholipid N-methyltransferase